MQRRVLVLAPRGRDAEVVASVVERDGAACDIVKNIDELVDAMERGAAAAIVSEESLNGVVSERLSAWLARQEPWSDFPFVVLLGKQVGGGGASRVKGALASLGNLVLLERPLSADTLASAAESALRARRRQYEARGILEQREAVSNELASLNAHLEQRVEDRTRALAQANDRLTAEVMERERAQQAVIQAQKLEALGRLTGGVAHDFNNLLNVIQGNMELIVMLGRDESIKTRARTAQAACKRGAKLTGQLLSFARSQALELRPLSVRTLFENVAELAAPILGSGVELIQLIEPEARSVLADASQAEMALLNLAINARDAMDGVGRITLRACKARPEREDLPDGDYVRIEVSDNGPGMSPEVAAKVFDPFFTTKGVGKGTGLGLSQVYGMAQQSGGGAYVRSVEGAGATIEIWLPAVDMATDFDDSEMGGIDHDVLAGLKVLVVEDDDLVRAGIVDALITLRCIVSQAGSGEDGLSAIDAAEPDFLLTDYLMPDMTGLNLAIRARERYPALPVLVATGYADMSAIEETLGKGAILRKPFQLAELGAAVARVAKKSGIGGDLSVAE